jgi:hypothetical protein
MVDGFGFSGSYTDLARIVRSMKTKRQQSASEFDPKIYGITLYPAQLEMLKAVEKLVDHDRDGTLCIRASRQTGKNEVAALCQVRYLQRYAGAGGNWIRCAPTWKPQIVNSIRRLEKYLFRRLVANWRGRYGYIVESGRANLYFLSADKSANVVGATADVCLDLDEAQDIDVETFDQKIAPFTASTNAPTLMWGVAGFKSDLLYQYRQDNLKAGRKKMNLDYPCDVFMELNPAYAKHVQSRIDRLGEDHFIIKTQYKLEDVDKVGHFLNRRQIESILESAHTRRSKPNFQLPVIMVIDVAGMHEEGEVTDPDDMSSGGRDSTVAYIVEVDYSPAAMRYQWPQCRILDIVWWTGKKYAEDTHGIEGQQELLLKMAQRWMPLKIVVDARGLGEQLAAYLNDRFLNVDMYKASPDSVCDDVFSLLGLINNGQVRVFRNDLSQEYKEFVAQLGAVDYKVVNGKVSLKKPVGGTTRHIDFVKTLSYIPRAIKDLSEGVGLTTTVGDNPL